MTGAQIMTDRERIEELELAVVELKHQLDVKEKVIAHAVLLSLREESILGEIMQQVVEKIEAEWTGKFLPELRRTVKADVMESLNTGTDL